MKIVKRHTWKHYNFGTPESIIFHIDLGTERGTTNWILTGPKSISYNYYIPRHGEYVIEFVPYQYGAWHSGVVSDPTPKAEKFYAGMNPNKRSIGICYEGKTVNTKPNAKQIALAKELNEYLKKKTNIKEHFAHVEITDYKPKVVLEFKDAVLKKEEKKKCKKCKRYESRIKSYQRKLDRCKCR